MTKGREENYYYIEDYDVKYKRAIARNIKELLRLIKEKKSDTEIF